MFSTLLAALSFSPVLGTYALTSKHISLVSSGVRLDALPVAQYVVNLTSKVQRPAEKANALRFLTNRETNSSTEDPDNTANISGADNDQEYLTDITIGGQPFKVVVDTGSSDTWLVNQKFRCFTLDNEPQDNESCAFGPNKFDINASTTYEPFPNHNFNISYGDGEFLTGDVGFDTVTVGGLSVTKQEIGVVNYAAWNGDNVSSGLLGLSYPSLTSVFNGTDPEEDTRANQVPYDPFFFTAVKQKKISEPIFSLALNRGSFSAENNSIEDPNLGTLAFGGIVPVPVTEKSVTVPIQGEQVNGSQQYFFYTVEVESYEFPGSDKLSTNGSSLLDSGTTLMYLPEDVANALAAAFQPPAKYSDEFGLHVVDCNATAPPFAVAIGGVSFNVTAADLILPSGTNDTNSCITGFAAGEGILGDSFLHNVVSTYDLGRNQVTLTERAPY